MKLARRLVPFVLPAFLFLFAPVAFAQQPPGPIRDIGDPLPAPPRPHVIEYGINVATMGGGLGTAIQLADLAARGTDWFVREGPIPTAGDVAPTIDDPTHDAYTYPDWDHPRMLDPQALGVHATILQGMYITEPSNPSVTVGRYPPGDEDNPYVLTWRGSGDVVLVAPNGNAGVIPVGDPLVINDPNDPLGGPQFVRKYMFDDHVVQNGKVSLSILRNPQGAPLIPVDPDDPPREIHMWLPGLASNPNPTPPDPQEPPLTRITGPILNPQWVADLQRMNNGLGPFVLRTLGWLDPAHYGGHANNRTRPVMSLDSRPHPARSLQAGNFGVAPQFHAAAANALGAHLHVTIPAQPLFRHVPPVAPFTPGKISQVDVQAGGSGFPSSTQVELVFVDSSVDPDTGVPNGGSGGSFLVTTTAGGSLPEGVLTVDQDPNTTGYYNARAVQVIAQDPTTQQPLGQDYYAEVKVQGNQFVEPGNPTNFHKHLSDADYEAWVEAFVEDVLQPSANDTDWNFGQPFTALDSDQRLIVELDNEVWNATAPSHLMIAALRGKGSNPNDAQKTEAEADEAYRVLEIAKGVVGDSVDQSGSRVRFFVGGSLQGGREDWLDDVLGHLAAKVPKPFLDAAGPTGYLPVRGEDRIRWNAAERCGLKSVMPIGINDFGFSVGDRLVGPLPTGTCDGTAVMDDALVEVTGVNMAGQIVGLSILMTGASYDPSQGPMMVFTKTTNPNLTATFQVSIGTGTMDPDEPEPVDIVESSRDEIPTLRGKLAINRAAITSSAWQQPMAGPRPEFYLYEAGFSHVPGNDVWGDEALAAVRIPEAFDVYTATSLMRDQGLVEALVAEDVTTVVWFRGVAPRAAGSALGGPFGHFEFLDQLLTQPVQWGGNYQHEGVPRGAAICRSRLGRERTD